MSQPKHQSIWDNLNNTKLIRYVLSFILAWAIVQIVAYFSSVIIIFIFAAIFAFLLSFPVQWAARIMPRGVAVVSVFLLGLFILIILQQGITLALTTLVSCILLQQVQENLLMPRIMKGSIDLNPVVMFFALLVGAKVAGLVGVFLSIPLAGIAIELCGIREMQQDHN
jgi:predicted PurR-regulated permease PerM